MHGLRAPENGRHEHIDTSALKRRNLPDQGHLREGEQVLAGDKPASSCHPEDHSPHRVRDARRLTTCGLDDGAELRARFLIVEQRVGGHERLGEQVARGC